MNKNGNHILLVYPPFPNKTYWGLQYSLPLADRRASFPPLGLLTVAAMAPSKYEFRLVDMNCRELLNDDLAWADVVCFSAMLHQKPTLFRTASRCKEAGKLVVFGGPFPTSCPQECEPYCDILVLNEGEVTWPAFLHDLEHETLCPLYSSDEKPDLRKTPVPRFDLLKIPDYALIPIQFSRGCPFQCEFCDIIALFGRRPRTKVPVQVIEELHALFTTGYRGGVFFADDNFIGNKRAVEDLMPDLQAWNKAKGHPFFYFTQASLNLADDRAFLKELVEADFKGVFLGIETPSKEGLKEAGKYQNIKDSLLDSVRIIQESGLVVHAGFIIGFDSDGEDIFDQHIEFITQAAIPNAFIEFLFALPGTALYTRLEREGRIEPFDYEHALDGYTNIVTLLPQRSLLEGYRKVIETLYTPSEYFKRALAHFSRLPRPTSRLAQLRHLRRVSAQVVSIFNAGTGNQKQSRVSLRKRLRVLKDFFRQFPLEYRRESLRFLSSFLKICPERLPGALLFIFMGLHFYRYSFEDVIPDLDRRLEHLSA